MKLFKTIALSRLIGYAVAFQPLAVRPQQQQQQVAATKLASSYLDSLSTVQTSPPSFVAAAANGEQQAATILKDDTVAVFSHAPIEYFALDQLTSKGPRTTADWGTPREATRKLVDDGTFRVGAWWCSDGGWPSPNPKAHTEVFYVMTGHACLSDADGVRHYFGPGDTVVIPKGNVGRWDVYEPIHKVWAVNDHERIEETSNPIRVHVEHYNSLHLQTSPEQATPLYGVDGSSCTRTFYHVGPTQTGSWTCRPDSFLVNKSDKRVFFHLLEGVLFVTGADGVARRCVPGDTVMLPKGWSGHIDVIEPAKKVWTTAE